MSTTVNEAFGLVVDWVSAILPDFEVLQGWQNGTALSGSTRDCVIVSVIELVRLDRGNRVYSDDSTEVTVTTGYRAVYQIDVWGPSGVRAAATLHGAWVSMAGCDLMGTDAILPLYATDPAPLGVVTGENTYEYRTTFEAHGQLSLTTTLPTLGGFDAVTVTTLNHED